MNNGTSSLAKDPATGKLKGPPVLESKGRDEFDDADNIVNYGSMKINGQ